MPPQLRAARIGNPRQRPDQNGSDTGQPEMARQSVPYLATRTNGDGSVRYYFQPRSKDTEHGWRTVRLHDKYEMPIGDAGAAAAACRAIAAVYSAWRSGGAGAGPQCIDELGRVIGKQASRQSSIPYRYLPGQVGAMIDDYLSHAIFLDELSEKTQAEYKIYLRLFKEEFGELNWQRVSAGAVRAWLMKRGASNGAAGAHALYRTVRAFFGKIRFCYDDVDHPGIVPENANPVANLQLALPDSRILVWPRSAVDAFVGLADERGHPSIGDAIVMMSWLGVRRLDWLGWPAAVFDRDLLAFRQKKTDIPLVLPWSIVPALADRVAEAKRRRSAMPEPSSTYFHDMHGRPWRNAASFRQQFNRLRDELEERQPAFSTRYYVGLVPDDPLSIPTAELTMRTMRHTCVTLNHDAGISRELIGSITGHSPESIDEIMAHYMARTADQAEAALTLRMKFEANPGRKRNPAFPSRKPGHSKAA